MGAWIEIEQLIEDYERARSLPSWERGLKCITPAINPRLNVVAPLVGAWIEIRCNPYPYTPLDVAPLVGAWIEIAALVSFWKFLDRRSPRGSVD